MSSDDADNLPEVPAPIIRDALIDPDLPGTAREVATAINLLVAQVRRLNNRLDKGERALKLTTVALVIGALSAAVLGFVVAHQFDTTSELREQQSQLAEQQRGIEVTRSEVLCPLYSVLLGSENPVSRDRYPAGPDAYNEAFVSLKRSALVLRCEAGLP